jgi:hypothetical protein
MSKHQGLVRPEGLDELKKCIHLIGSRARVLPACSIVLQPIRYRVTPTPATNVCKLPPAPQEVFVSVLSLLVIVLSGITRQSSSRWKIQGVGVVLSACVNAAN